MLLLYILLLSSCFSGSMGSAIQEFQENFKTLVRLASKEVFLPVPDEKFECSHVPCHLARVIERLKARFKNDQLRAYVPLMEKNVNHIKSTLYKTHTKPEKGGSCLITEVLLPTALKHYQRFFRKVEEHC